MLRCINHTNGTVQRESQMAKKRFGKELKDCTVIGVIPSSEKGQGGVEMLYLCVTEQDKQKSHSPFTFAASLLGNSKVLFFSHLVKLLNLVDSDLCRPLYTDTDSVYLLCRKKNLVDCIRKDKLEEYERVKHTIFGDLSAKESQAGLLISEGQYK